MKKQHKPLKIVLISVGSALALALALVGGFIIYASATTLNPKDVESVEVRGTTSNKVDKNNEIKLLTWNVGYGALDERQDCYWDGGKGVLGESKEVVEENITALRTKINEINPDIFFLQEVDINSKRSYFINELEIFKETFDENHYHNTFARNFKAGVVPLPINNMTGKVDAGISIFSKFEVGAATRIQLPIPFKWPISLFNLKRCLLINRLPIKDSAKQLVLINLHLEAYDDGEGKAQQLAMLMDKAQEEYSNGHYVIIGGDFNQTFSTTNYQKYPKMNDWVCPVIEAANYPDFTFRMDDTYPTCRTLAVPYVNADKSDFQYYMIDGFAVSKNITINNLETLNLGFKNTDHNPVLMSVTLL